MATALATDLMTAGEYLRLPDNGTLTELVRGRIVDIRTYPRTSKTSAIPAESGVLG